MMFKKILILASFLFLGTGTFLHAADAELRGVWFAWAGSDIPSNTDIARAMDALADANMNVVYVDVWRYGYPYFKSDTFHKYTGLYTDPAVGNRDILAEMIAEGHRAGLEVEAWFEAGFMATQGYNDHMYQAKPEWFAKDREGNVPLYGAGGMSLSHTHPEAWQFLIDLTQDVIRNYDVDGVEFDRVRYPGLDCGYDSTTIALYKADHDGNEPPDNTANSDWIRWRADKLTDFVGVFYDSIKAVNPDIIVSNAPLPWGYEQFCQDWVAWVNQGFLDVAQVQMYNSTNDAYVWRLDTERTKMNDQSLLYPGIATAANGNTTTPEELIKMINSTRDRNLNGNVIWYHKPLISGTYLAELKASVYAEKTEIPYRDENWRIPVIIINEDDGRMTEKSGDWIEKTPAQGYNGYEGGIYYAETSSDAWLDYYANIDEEGWYEVYVFHYQQAYATTRAPYTVYHRDGETTYLVNQKAKQARWVKLGDVWLEPGFKQKVVGLTTENTDNNFVFADAVMLIKSRRPGITPPVSIESTPVPHTYRLPEIFPNPFNNQCQIRFSLEQEGFTELILWDIQGRHIETLDSRFRQAGDYTVHFTADNHLVSGLYILSIKRDGKQIQSTKMVYVK
jgi:uncharacterized lipoprotein YddW (UPF0748 family)